MTTIFGPENNITSDNSDPSASHRELCPITGSSLGQVRATFKASTAAGTFVTNNCGIGVSAGGTSSQNTTVTPVELKFGGASGFTIAQGTSRASDWANLNFASSDKLVVIFDTTSVNNAFSWSAGAALSPQTCDDYFFSAGGTYNVAVTAPPTLITTTSCNAVITIETQAGVAAGPPPTISMIYV